MSSWRHGKIKWFSDDFEEGMIEDSQNGEFYYLNMSAAKKYKKLKNLKKTENIKFKLTEFPRSILATDVSFEETA